ncbi:unnamed protein product, partial [Brenthis ino]
MDKGTTVRIVLDVGCFGDALKRTWAAEVEFGQKEPPSYTLVIYFDFTKGGSRVLVVNGERFNKQSCNGGKVSWRCIKRNLGCKSTVWTFDDEIVKIRDDHMH